MCKEGEVKLVLAYIAVWFGSGLVPAAGLTPHFTTAPHASPDYILSVFPGCTELSWSCAVNGQIDAHSSPASLLVTLAGTMFPDVIADGNRII